MTKSEIIYLKYLVNNIKKVDLAPTLSEMARNAKIKPVHYTDAQENERKLEARGFIEREPLFVKRNVKVTKKGLDALKKLNPKNE